MNQHAYISYTNRYAMLYKCVPYYQIKSDYAPVAGNNCSHMFIRIIYISTQLRDVGSVYAYKFFLIYILSMSSLLLILLLL